MGGNFYDRVMDTTSSNSVNGYGKPLDPLLDPLQYKNTNIVSTTRHPIVFALDVSGSMSDWPQIIYDKMPMFYGQIMMQGYLTDPSISFCAIADLDDDICMQTSRFSKASDIDEQLTKISLGGGSGPTTRCEAYELPAHFYTYMCDLTNCHMPFFFLTCDENYHTILGRDQVIKFLGRDPETDVQGKKIFQKLMTKFNVFIIKKLYGDISESEEYEMWEDTVGKNRVLRISNPKACIDLILGAIAVTFGLTLEKFVDDMRTRGQTEERIKEVSESLKLYYDCLKDGSTIPISHEVKEEEVSSVVNNLNNFIKNFGTLSFDEENTKLYNNYLKISNDFQGKIPDELICPLTNKLILNAVRICDGTVFERQAIEKWFKDNNTNPLNGNLLENKEFETDHKTNAEVQEFYESYKDLN